MAEIGGNNRSTGAGWRMGRECILFGRQGDHGHRDQRKIERQALFLDIEKPGPAFPRPDEAVVIQIRVSAVTLNVTFVAKVKIYLPLQCGR